MEIRRATQQTRIASGLSVIVAIWEILAPFLLGYSGMVVPTTNAIVVGLLVGILAAVRYLGTAALNWLSWINVVAGLWLAISPFVLGYSGVSAATVNDIVIGIVIIGLNAWAALADRFVPS